MNRRLTCSSRFFVQAEDCIRSRNVTGVQTCALPIYIYELLDLEIGKCKFSVAGPIDHPPLDEVSQLTVASKYPGVAEKFFKEKGIEVDLIKLNGSVELAPLIGMSDVIVDIVETGNTIRENGLKVMDDIEDISTRLIVNKSSFATKTKSIQYIIDQFRAGLE